MTDRDLVRRLASRAYSVDLTPIDAKTLALGMKHTGKPLRAAAKEALARLKADALPESPSSNVDVEAAYAAMVGLRRAKDAEADALVSFWALRSPAFALDVALRTSSVVVTTLFDDDTAAVEESEDYSGNPWYVPQAWRGLRKALASANPKAYASARAHAEQLRRKLAPSLRSYVSFAFPKEGGWARAEADAALMIAKLPHHATLLLATELDLGRATKIAQAMVNKYFVVELLPSIVQIHGPAALRIFRIFLGSKASVAARRALAEAICHIDTRDAAAVVAAHLGDKHFHPAARDYFVRHPTLAPVLEPIAAGASKDAGLARAILADACANVPPSDCPTERRRAGARSR